MARWTPEQVAQVAPDANSLAAARKLARPGPWQETGCNEVLVWGKCQGSGSSAYQVSVDLVGPAYRCSCPSRKFPCKHALALLMLWSEGGLSETGEVAAYAQEWADQRADRTEARATRTTQPDQAADPQAQAKRLAERLARMDAGVEDFRVWLTDLVRAGLAAARKHPWSWWDTAAARLVDAQLPGLAERVREAGSQVHARADWSDYLLAELGRWWAITGAWQSRDSLDPATLADLRVAVGWAQSADEVRAGDVVAGPWTVLGAHRSDDGRLQQQRTWVASDAGELGVVLDFAGYGQALATPQLGGARLSVDIARYPGTPPHRVLFRADPVASGAATTLPGRTSIASVTASAASALAQVPWRGRHPAALGAARLAEHEGRWQVVDDTGALPLSDDAEVWRLLATSGGQPVDLFGEFDAGSFRPLTVWLDTGVVTL